VLCGYVACLEAVDGPATSALVPSEELASKASSSSPTTAATSPIGANWEGEAVKTAVSLTIREASRLGVMGSLFERSPCLKRAQVLWPRAALLTLAHLRQRRLKPEAWLARESGEETDSGLHAGDYASPAVLNSDRALMCERAI